MNEERVKEIEKKMKHDDLMWNSGEYDMKFLIDTVKQQNEQIEGKDKQLKIIYNIIHAKQRQTQQKDQRIEELEVVIRAVKKKVGTDLSGIRNASLNEIYVMLQKALNK